MESAQLMALCRKFPFSIQIEGTPHLLWVPVFQKYVLYIYFFTMFCSTIHRVLNDFCCDV
jgi:hypothetical protein